MWAQCVARGRVVHWESGGRESEFFHPLSHSRSDWICFTFPEKWLLWQPFEEKKTSCRLSNGDIIVEFLDPQPQPAWHGRHRVNCVGGGSSLWWSLPIIYWLLFVHYMLLGIDPPQIFRRLFHLCQQWLQQLAISGLAIGFNRSIASELLLEWMLFHIFFLPVKRHCQQKNKNKSFLRLIIGWLQQKRNKEVQTTEVQIKTVTNSRSFSNSILLSPSNFPVASTGICAWTQKLSFCSF